METGVLYQLVLLFLLCGTLTALVPRIKEKTVNGLAHGFAAFACIAGVLCAFSVFSRQAWQSSFILCEPFGEVTLGIDQLSAIFILALGLVGFAASMFAIGYTKEYYGKAFRQLTALWNLFLLSMFLVFTVRHALAFLMAWELMALVSFFLVAQDREDPKVSRAAYLYMIMTHVGTVFVASAFFILAAHGAGFDFSTLAAGTMSGELKNIVFICALIGFGAKAGMIPIHIWLPRAHPAAPSHVSALMSGIMLKTAIYGMARFFWEFLGTGPAWWGVLVLSVAALSAGFGILYAVMANDLKRLLAYSSVDNIGIILLGMGAGLVFSAKGQPVLAGIAWSASLYHTVGHAVFKSLLFMGAGSVLVNAHTRNMELLGGLIRRMPYTAFFFLAGTLSITALPPLSGFVSEWLTFQALFLLPAAISGISGKLAAAALIAVFGLTGALTAACFVKAFGIVFLAKPRSRQAAQACEAPCIMTLPLGFLAAVSLLLGMYPGFLLGLIGQVLSGIPGAVPVLQDGLSGYAGLSAQVNGSLLSPVLLLSLLAVGLLGAGLLFRQAGKSRIISGETWTCGIVPAAQMQYTGTGFAKPLRIAFRFVLRPQREFVATEGSSRYYGRQMSYNLSIRYLFLEMYQPLRSLLLRLSYNMKRIQAGSVQLYVGYITFVTVLVLVWNAWWGN